MSSIDNRPVSIEQFIRFLNLEGIELDEYILESTLNTAIEYCSKRNETVYTKENCPHIVKQAILGLATHYFENRTGEASQSEQVVLKGVERLLDLAREKFTF